MKSQLKKLTAIFLSICVVLSLTTVISFAADTTATISFASTAQRTEYTTSKQVWEQNGITVTNDKASSSTNVGNYYNPARFYKGSKVTIEYPQKMSKIEIATPSSDYATVWSKSFTDSNATATVSGTKITIAFTNPVETFVFSSMSAQSRASSITITVSAEAAACEHPNTTETRTETTTTALGSIVVTCDDCGKEISTEVLGADVTYVVPKGEITPEGVTDVTKVTLPEPEALDAEYADTYEFAGWAKADFEATTIEPDLFEAGLEVELTGHTTFYAVYTYSAEATSGDKEYVLTDIADITATDKVVVTMTYKDGTVYTLGNNNGTGSAPAAATVEVTGNKITSDVENTMIWNIANSNGSLTFYPDGKTNVWLYCTSSNNGVRVGTNTAKTFTIDAASGYLMHTGTGRFVGVYRTNPDWRCYTNTTGNTADQTLGFYVETATAGTVTYYTTSLGTVDGANIEVGTDLTVNFYVDDAKLTDSKMTFTMDGETVTVEEKNAQGAFAFENVPPHCMTETITANLYDGDKLVAAKEYSVKENLEALLDMPETGDTTKQFIYNMLYYGAASQEYVAQKNGTEVENELASEGITSPDAIEFASDVAEGITLTESTTGEMYFKSANIWFDNQNSIIANLQNLPENAKIRVSKGSVVEYEGAATTKYVTEGLKATEFDTIYTFEVLDAEGTTLQTLTYSVNYYAYAMQNNAKIGELAKALYSYGVSAKNV